MKLRVETAGMDRLALEFNTLARQGPSIMATTLNTAGRELRKATVAAEARQTNLKSSTINKAQKEHRASPGSLVYEITSEGGDVRAKFFNPHEGDGGTTAFPWGKAMLFRGAFMSGGRLGKRVPLGMGNAVLVRTGRARLPVKQVRTGLFIPVEMTTGSTLKTFDSGTGQIVDVVIRRLGALLG